MLYMFNSHTKFDFPSFYRSGDISLGVKFQKAPPDSFFQWWYIIGRLAMVNLCTRFEVFILYSHPIPKIWKTVQNAKMGWFGVVRSHSRSSPMPSFHTTHMISYSAQIEMCLCVYLIPFSRYSEILSKFTDFNPPDLRLAPPLGWPRLNFAKIFGVRMPDSLG